MTRRYGAIATSIWGDPEFRKLSSEAQRVYLMIITQPGITSVGTLAVTLRRWAQYSADSLSDRLCDALSELADRLFLVIDWDYEELLVRSFVRWDGGHSNPKRLPAIRSAAITVGSPLLAGVLSFELTRLGVTHEISADPIDRLSDSLSDRHPDSPRVVVTTEVTNATHNPQQATHNPKPEKRPESAAADLPTRYDVEHICRHLADKIEDNGSKRPAITKRWRDDARLMLDKDGRTESQVIAAIDWCQAHSFWRINIMSVPKLREQFDKLRLAAAEQTEKSHKGGPAPQNGYQPSTSELRAGQAMALSEEYRAQEEAAEHRAQTKALEIDA